MMHSFRWTVAILKNTTDIQGAYVHGVLKEFLRSLALAVNQIYV